MTVTVRFAPSPTGFLHVGNARIALINWLFARRQGGTFILRLDDTDTERSRVEYANAIREDLAWLGLAWDREEAQSARLARYQAAVERLKAACRLYPCYETPNELEFKRKRLMARGKPPVYDRSALNLTAEDKVKLEAEGRKPHWRFLLRSEEVRWDDLVRGECHYHGDHLSDPVLIRADGTPLYTLPSVVDDVEMEISHVIRGEDHVTNTAAQIQLFEALGARPPGFAHLPLLTDATGQGLSKRLGSLSLRDLRADGIEALAVDALLAGLGSSHAIEPKATLEDLIAGFDMAAFGRATPKFDPAELGRLNAGILHAMSFSDVSARLKALGIDGDEDFWLAVRGNLTKLADALDWWAVCQGPVTPVIEDSELTAAAADLLPTEPWDQQTWPALTELVKARTGRKGKALFHPLRLALTGRENGPELKALLPLIGRTRAVARLRGDNA